MNTTLKNGLFLLIIVILCLIQVAILDNFKVFGVKPDLLLISVFITSLFFGIKWAIFFGIFTGILKDVFAINAFGINTLLFPLWCFTIIKLSKKISLDNNFICVAVVFVMGTLSDIMIRLMFMFLGYRVISLSVFLRITLFESLYTALIAPLVFKIIKPVLSRYIFV